MIGGYTAYLLKLDGESPQPVELGVGIAQSKTRLFELSLNFLHPGCHGSLFGGRLLQQALFPTLSISSCTLLAAHRICKSLHTNKRSKKMEGNREISHKHLCEKVTELMDESRTTQSYPRFIKKIGINADFNSLVPIYGALEI